MFEELSPASPQKLTEGKTNMNNPHDLGVQGITLKKHCYKCDRIPATQWLTLGTSTVQDPALHGRNTMVGQTILPLL